MYKTAVWICMEWRGRGGERSGWKSKIHLFHYLFIQQMFVSSVMCQPCGMGLGTPSGYKLTAEEFGISEDGRRKAGPLKVEEWER